MNYGTRQRIERMRKKIIKSELWNQVENRAMRNKGIKNELWNQVQDRAFA